MSGITAIILTYNEELHLGRCIASLTPICDRICIIDSFSTDRTIEIAKGLGAEVYQNPWENNYAAQLNWGINQINAKTDWTIRIDADEYLSPELINELKSILTSIPNDVSGIELTRKVLFKGKWIRFGGFYPIHLLRIWRSGQGLCESRLMDEHMILSGGKILRLQENLIDENLNSIHWWVNKHNNYARREAADILNQEFSFVETTDLAGVEVGKQAASKRKVKNNLYNKLPLGLRSLLYFCFRFFLQLGFLDHPKVWIFHFMQGFWYRLLVDINVYEAKAACQGDVFRLREYVRNEWKIKI
ncbi:glycosyltransferase family 2 protein [Aquirufa echingensis]|uniref:Glycosyltransferase family 2 protein n=1 Tax=Aquirufa echingensis TaxID=3096516 RepID=A0ABW6D938_9BACT